MSEIRFDHIAIGMQRMADAPAVLVGALGGAPTAGRLSGVFRWGLWTFRGGGALEVLEPVGADGFLHRFLAQRGPGVHHVTFKVPSLDEVCARARARGYDVVGRDDSDPTWKEAFLHPRQALGIVVQLAEVSGGGGVAPGAWQPPPGPPDPPPPVTILGLRLRAHRRERAAAQWEGVLGGQPSDGPAGELIYRWPRSPMRLAVEVDASGEEGPLAIEFASERPVRVPAGPHPVLGVALVQCAAAG
jgi:methylmalonyl-CoA/ethylmalonyl-CoA epimerase